MEECAASPPAAARGKHAGPGQQPPAESESSDSAADGRDSQRGQVIWSEGLLCAVAALESLIHRISRAVR